MKRILAVTAALAARLLCAGLTSATWGTAPSAPVYAGQDYDLTLTLITEQDEEVSGLKSEQGPQTNPDAQSHLIRDGKRITTLRWHQNAARPKLVALPAGRLFVSLSTVKTFGFGRTVFTDTADGTIPAFSYDVVALPPEAEGAALGRFVYTLRSDAPTFASGDIRRITAELRAIEGRIPETLTLALEPPTTGRLYDFEVTRTPKQLTATAYYVTDGAAPITLKAKPINIFDLATRTRKPLNARPLTLMWVPETAAAEEEPTEITLGEGETGLPLRFAPRDTAPVIGVLPNAHREAALAAPLERYEGWMRVRAANGASGWLRPPKTEPAQAQEEATP